MAVLAASFVSACATSSFGLAQPGEARDVVIARMGPPTRILALPEGERFQYSQQPRGFHAWMVDIDRTGRVARVRDAMTLQEFNRIQPGWSRSDIEREFGPPAYVDRVASWAGDVYTYRWQELNNPMFYWVYFDPAGRVGRAHQGMEFINAPNRD